MVIPQFLIGLSEKEQTKYFFLTSEAQTQPIDIPARFVFYNANAGMICGIGNKNGKDVVGRAKLFPEQEGFSPLFTLSNSRLFHTAVSPDNQKIAFLAQDETTRETRLRVIVREEFGWFPLAFIRLKVSPAPVCFCTPDVLMFTSETGALMAVRLSKPVKTVEISPAGHSPAYSAVNRAKAFIQNHEIIIIRQKAEKITVSQPSALAFSKTGQELFFADQSVLYGYDPVSKRKRRIFDASRPICFIAEL